MNILLIGKPHDNIINVLKDSVFLDKLYIAGDYKSETIPNFGYKSVSELAEKAKTLQIDIAINLDKTLINNGICEDFRRNKINLISANKKWLNLETNKFAAKQLLTYYSVNTTQILKVPSVFPVSVKTEYNEYIVNSMTELTKLAENLKEQYYIEEYLTGDTFNLLSIWDGENLYFFNSPENINEIKDDRLDLLKTKLKFMFSDEKANFIGFFTTHLIWAKNDWYVKSFSMGINSDIDIKSALAKTKTDFLYILNSAIYQKLNEIR